MLLSGEEGPTLTAYSCLQPQLTDETCLLEFCLTFTFTFRAFSRHFCPKRLTISTFVTREKRDKLQRAFSDFLN